MSASESLFPGARELAGKMKPLIYGRLSAAFALVIIAWWWTAEVAGQSGSRFPAGLLLLFLTVTVLTGAYHLLAGLNRNLPAQVRLQLSIDVLLVTWLVWETGDLTSPYVTLYIVTICLAGFLLSKFDTLAIAGASALSFIVLAVLTGQAVIYSLSGEFPSSRIVQIVSFNVVGFLVVGLLAARLAERYRIADRLAQSERSFADLHILHERILQSVDSGLITTDLAGTIYAFNRAAESITRMNAADVLGSSVLTVFGEDLSKAVEVCLGSVQSEEFSSEHFETRIKTASGEMITIACSLSPLWSRSREVSGLILSFQDISHVRALEESLRRSDRLAAVGRMAAGLAHEIRNPLGSLSSSLQFLRSKEPPDSEDRVLMDVVLREAERLNGIISGLLTFVKPASDRRRTATAQATDIDSALRDCLTLLRHDPDVKESHQFNYVAPATRIETQMSETQIKQVFWNLLTNSINAMPDGGKVDVQLNELPGKGVQIIFNDDGRGIDRDNMEHLFEPFAAAAGGTGLGLSIVHKIVSDNGGRIDVRSGSGTGTRITVELPR